MSTPIISKTNRGRGATKPEYTCPDCGHTWKRTGKGKFAVCPKCYEAEHGKPMGQHFRETKGLTLKIRGPKVTPPATTPPADPAATQEHLEQDPPGGPVTFPIQEPEPAPAEPPKQSGFLATLRSALEKPIFERSENND